MSGRNKHKYKNTINVAHTTFPMRAKLPKQQKSIIKFCTDNNINKEIISQKGSGSPVVLHGGPPYANGELHIGHALNIIFKDIYLRYHQQMGRPIEYKSGFDCNGLPIELNALKQCDHLEKLSIKEKRKLCNNFADKYVAIQDNTISSMGILRENSYFKTSDHTNEIYEVYNELLMKGLVFKKNLPMLWSFEEKTVVSNADMEYKSIESTAITMTVDILDGKFKGLKIAFFTTTPWSVFDNVAIAYNSVFEYINVDGIFYAKKLVDEELSKGKEIVLGESFANSHYAHPTNGKSCPIIHSDHVTNTMGTGFVHIAPAHGLEDYEIGELYSLPIIDSVDEGGYIQLGAEEKLFLFDSDNIIKTLGNNIIKTEPFTHSYPYSSRGKCPLFYRSSEQLFIDIKPITEAKLRRALADVETIPKNLKSVFSNLVMQRKYWCISRNRIHGVPLPTFEEKDSKKMLISKSLQKKIMQHMKSDPDIFFDEEKVFELYKNFVNPKKYKYLCFVADVWLDSGCVSQFSHLRGKRGTYIEGQDQMRGWFQSSLLVALLLNRPVPYNKLIMHGFVTDDQHRKMSKSLGNGLPIGLFAEEHGFEILRIWVMNTEFTNSKIPIGDKIIEECKTHYKKVRNCMRFLISIFETYKIPNRSAKLREEHNILLDFCYYKCNGVYDEMEKGNNRKAWNHITELIGLISANFFNAIKTTLYCGDVQDNNYQSILKLCYEIFKCLLKIITFILPMTAEEIFQHTVKNNIFISDFSGISVHLNAFKIPKNKELYTKVVDVMHTIKIIQKGSNEFIASKKIRRISECSAEIKEEKDVKLLQLLLPMHVSPGTQTRVVIPEENSCSRCGYTVRMYTNVNSELCSTCELVIKKYHPQQIQS